ncbi:hypothetical protein [Hahella chejuensis]|uniref:hypothetical protein n=1 Tax=Hahella chejuensis TaxID=158327 RepID=UPI0011D0C956|nr:hypothetical protein [Hahella chejuensis]
MNDYPLKENADEGVLVCCHLMDGAELHWVHHLPEEQCVWAFMCAKEHERSDMVQKTLEEACRLFPEIGELADVPHDMDVSFKKGKNSGKWYDFYRSK